MSGESADDSGVVPHDESRPFGDIADKGEAVMDADEFRCWICGFCDCPLVVLPIVPLPTLGEVPLALVKER